MSDKPDLDKYFERIGHSGSTAPTLATLESIHALHVESIPFENLSPFLGEPVPLDLASLERKMLSGGRGGWCFEHNLLFSHVLIAMGYQVTRLAARVRWNVPAGTVTARSHMLLRVAIGGRDHIADVGFGGLTLASPLRLEADIEQATAHEPHRLAREGEGFVLHAKVGGEWQALYFFELHEQQLADYEVSNWYLSTHPRSQFVSGIIAARVDPDRRHALRNTRYAIHHDDGRTEKCFVADVGAYKRLLAEAFRITVPEAKDIDERLARMIAANPSSEK